MKNITEIQKQIEELQKAIAHVANNEVETVYQFDEDGMRAFIEEIASATRDKVIDSIREGSADIDADDVCEIDLDGHCINVSIDEEMLAKQLENHFDDNGEFDEDEIEEMMNEAKQYHVVTARPSKKK